MSLHEEPKKLQDLCVSMCVHTHIPSQRLLGLFRCEVVACVLCSVRTWITLASLSEWCRCFLQEAVEENEQRKKQEEAMREKLLAQEAKQRDPKVKSKS